MLKLKARVPESKRLSRRLDEYTTRDPSNPRTKVLVKMMYAKVKSKSINPT